MEMSAVQRVLLIRYVVEVT